MSTSPAGLVPIWARDAAPVERDANDASQGGEHSKRARESAGKRFTGQGWEGRSQMLSLRQS
jgi:hypothetical protein